MGRKAKRAKALVRRMRISGQEIDPEIARACGVEKQNQELIDARLAKEAEERRLVEEAERKEREAKEAKKKAEADAKKKAEAARKRKEAAAKKKAEAAKAKKQSPKE